MSGSPRPAPWRRSRTRTRPDGRPVTWDPRTPPSQAGTTIVVTGGNAGVGYFTSEQLAAAGARVVLASRSAETAQLAIDSIRERVPAAALEFVRLDLTSLASVAEAAHAVVDPAITEAEVLAHEAAAKLAVDKATAARAGLYLLPLRRRGAY